MANIGSVFLGDVQRHRLLSTTSSASADSRSPPSSPPPSSISGVFPISSMHSPPPSSSAAEQQRRATTHAQPVAATTTVPTAPGTKTATIDPALALELRVRWLEALVRGVNHSNATGGGTSKHLQEKEKDIRQGQTLVKLAEDVRRRLDAVVVGNEGLKKFMAHYDEHARFLTPSFALSGTLHDPPPTYEEMTQEELDALLTEMESEIRAADRDMREIEMLEKKGVTEAGKLPEYEALKPRLEGLLQANEKDAKMAASLERRIASLMQRHATQVDALSELFVTWDDALISTSNTLTKLERERAERQRLGFE